MSVTERFADTGDALSDLATHFIVECPKCHAKAQVLPHFDGWRLTCSKCFLVEEPGHWYGATTAYVSAKCRECNQPISRKAESGGKWMKLKLKCLHCGDECEYEARLLRHFIHNGLVCDQVFGLPLWLQKEFGDELFWAFNYDHLKMLEDFIGAKLRERGIEPRNTIRKNSSMASRLPEFIQKAGNREKLLKLIHNLQVK